MLMSNVPRGSGFSKRFLWSLVIGLFLLMILFLYFMNHYAPQKRKATTPETIINASEATHFIESLQLENKSASTVPIRTVDATKKSTNTPNARFFREASQSAISVYRAEHSSNQKMTDSAGLPLEGSALATPQNGEDNNAYSAQNQQNEKTRFLQNASHHSETLINTVAEAPHSLYELKAGTLLPATLQTGIQSDLPGTIIAKLRQDVFDTRTGNYLLIPQGTTLIGVYDSEVAYGQERVLIAWQRLIFPNGMSQNLEGQAGVDLLGLAGLQDKINHHYFRVFGSAVMFSLFGAAAQLSQPQMNNNNVLSPQQIIAGAMGQQLSETGAQLVARNMNIQPTIMIRPGANFNVLLAKDLILPGPYRHGGT